MRKEEMIKKAKEYFEKEEIKIPEFAQFAQATHEELCDAALKHYEEISIEAMHHNSLIPKAIKFYKKYYPKNRETPPNSTKP